MPVELSEQHVVLGFGELSRPRKVRNPTAATRSGITVGRRYIKPTHALFVGRPPTRFSRELHLCFGDVPHFEELGSLIQENAPFEKNKPDTKGKAHGQRTQ